LIVIRDRAAQSCGRQSEFREGHELESCRQGSFKFVIPNRSKPRWRDENARGIRSLVLVVGRNEETMYSGTFIDELIKTVERSERRSLQASTPEEKLAHFYAVAQNEITHYETMLVGAA
jgi:hypothetical protein